MATILKSGEREFRENPGRRELFRLFTDASRAERGVVPQTLNFDLRQLSPGQYSSAYHFHRNAEELFMIVAGSATLRTPAGLEEVGAGDLIFIETGASGAHQLYNHTDEICTYLDIRTFNGCDVCEYPDTGKLLIIPTMEAFGRDTRQGYFDGEENVADIWQKIRQESEK